MRDHSISSIYFNGNEINFSFVRESGFKNMELRCDDILQNDDPDEIEKVKRILIKNSMKLTSLHSFFREVDISSEDKWLRMKSVREIEKSIIVASRLQCPYIIAHLSAKLQNNISKDKLMKNSFESIKEAIETAKRMNVRILLENLPLSMLLSGIDEINNVIDAGYKLCFDLGHALMTAIDPIKFCLDYKEKISVVHVHFNDGKTDSHSFFKTDDEKNLLLRIAEILPKSVAFIYEVISERYLKDIYEEVKRI